MTTMKNEFDSVPHKLMSVGCGIDGDGMVYAMYGWDAKTKLMAYDMDNGTHIDNIEPDGDWMNALSADDRKTIGDMQPTMRRSRRHQR